MQLEKHKLNTHINPHYHPTTAPKSIFCSSHPTEVASTYDPVAFSAFTSVTHTCSNVVRFGGVITNVGGAYSQLNSTFVCPHRGIYMFSVSVTVSGVVVVDSIFLLFGEY